MLARLFLFGSDRCQFGQLFFLISISWRIHYSSAFTATSLLNFFLNFFAQFINLPIFLFHFTIVGINQNFQFRFFILKIFTCLLYFIKLDWLFWKFLLCSDQFFPQNSLSLTLCNNFILNLMEFCELFFFDLLLILKFDSLAAHFKQIKQSHFVNEFGRVVWIVNNIFPDFAFLNVLLFILLFVLTILLFLLIPLIPIRVKLLCDLLQFSGFAVLNLGEWFLDVYFFVQSLAHLIPESIEYFQKVILCCVFR